MTKSHEKGENEITDEARQKALRTGRPICDILREMLRDAKADKDPQREQKIKRAEKYLGCRNKRKRARNS
jgi:hypothetical protein